MPKYKGESEDNKLLKEVGINPNTLKFTPDSYTLDKNGKIKSIKLGSGKIIKKAQGGSVALKKGGKVKKKSGGSKPKNPALYARVKAEAKRKFKVYPSAYANAWLVRTYKKRGGTY